MKNIKILVIGLAVLLGFSACSESWLDNDLDGSTLSQEDFDAIPSTNEGLVRGLYSYLYASGSDHHNFGQKSIDIATDFLSGDMSMSQASYGWFVSDAQFLGAAASGSRNAYMWNYYYSIIMNANMLIRKLDTKSSTTDLTQEEQYYYAQALTMRAFCYYSLLNFYTPGRTDSNEGYMGGSGLAYRAVPIYNETTYNDKGLPLEQDLSTKETLIATVHSDLGAALAFFNNLNPDSVPARPSKLYVDANIARAFNAYTFLIEEKWDTAYKVAMEIIESPENTYAILPYEDVLTTGFADVNNASWMWGLDVTVETTTGLASFWGHMDIYTYSYASAGALKVIDDNLYKEIPAYDVRKQWFDATNLNPIWKFYDKNRGTGNDADRRWLNDIVFMRIEEIYLIAAEAACRNNDLASAKTLLKDLVGERYDAELAAEDTPVPDIDALDATGLLKELEYNWRIELWGEGRSLATFKRFGNIHKTGSRRAFEKNSDIEPTDPRILFRCPNSELSQNMAITYNN